MSEEFELPSPQVQQNHLVDYVLTPFRNWSKLLSRSTFKEDIGMNAALLVPLHVACIELRLFAVPLVQRVLPDIHTIAVALRLGAGAGAGKCLMIHAM